MADMSIQDRYNEIVRLSGLSEDIVRRVLKASRQSLVASLKRGDRATLPGICTMLPDIRNKFDINTGKQSFFIKVKAKASNSMTSEIEKASNFVTDDNIEVNNGGIQLNLDNAGLNSVKESGIRTKQISSLL